VLLGDGDGARVLLGDGARVLLGDGDGARVLLGDGDRDGDRDTRFPRGAASCATEAGRRAAPQWRDGRLISVRSLLAIRNATRCDRAARRLGSRRWGGWRR